MERKDKRREGDGESIMIHHLGMMDNDVRSSR